MKSVRYGRWLNNAGGGIGRRLRQIRSSVERKTAGLQTIKDFRGLYNLLYVWCCKSTPGN